MIFRKAASDRSFCLVMKNIQMFHGFLNSNNWKTILDTNLDTQQWVSLVSLTHPYFWWAIIKVHQHREFKPTNSVITVSFWDGWINPAPVAGMIIWDQCFCLVSDSWITHQSTTVYNYLLIFMKNSTSAHCNMIWERHWF